MQDIIEKRYKNGLVIELASYYPDLQGWYENSEIETQDWMIDNVKPDWVCFDVGAHLGYYTFLLSTLACRGRVYAFEPWLPTYEMMIANWKHNLARGMLLNNISTVNLALGDESGLLEEKIWTSRGSQDANPENVVAQFMTVDQVVNGGRIDFIKCDVDGWDLEVLRGARQTMKSQRPIIIAEMNYALAWRGHSALEVREYLESLNYVDFPIDACPGNWLIMPREKCAS
jgi:FkbM family methyltransferase